MPALIINGTTFNDVITGALAQGNYYALPDIGQAPIVTGPGFRETCGMFLGIPGEWTKRFNTFGSRMIHAEIVLIGTLAQNATLKKTLQDSFGQLARYSITMPSGAEYKGCKVQPNGGRTIKRMQLSGKELEVIEFDFKQYSDEN